MEYDDGVDSETCAWFDILMHKFFQSFCLTINQVDMEALLNHRLASLNVPQFVVPYFQSPVTLDLQLIVAPCMAVVIVQGPLVVQQVHFGETIPVVRGIRVLSWRDERPLVC